MSRGGRNSKGVFAANARVALLWPVVVVALMVALVALPFYGLYRLVLRCLVEVLWCARGRRILLIYSRSPVWQHYIESHWLPRLGDRAVILNWSDRAAWWRTAPFAALVFGHWAPYEDFNPMALVFRGFPRTRRIGFFYAFRDWKHGKDGTLKAAEAELFGFVDHHH